MSSTRLKTTLLHSPILPTMSATQSIVSIGKLCAICQAGPDRIRAAADVLRIKPALSINGVPHYDETDVPRIAHHLHTSRRRTKPHQQET